MTAVADAQKQSRRNLSPQRVSGASHVLLSPDTPHLEGWWMVRTAAWLASRYLFSELPHYPRASMRMDNKEDLPSHVDRKWNPTGAASYFGSAARKGWARRVHGLQGSQEASWTFSGVSGRSTVVRERESERARSRRGCDPPPFADVTPCWRLWARALLPAHHIIHQ